MDRITGRLWIGDYADVTSTSLHPLGISAVIGVCQDSAAVNIGSGIDYQHFALADGVEMGHVPGDASFEAFDRAVEAVRSAMDRGETVLVHCHRGRSRSVSVAAAALAVRDGISWDTALARICAHRPEADPSPIPTEHGRRYVTAHT